MNNKKLKKQLHRIINYTIEAAIKSFEDVEKIDTIFLKNFIYECLNNHVKMKTMFGDEYGELSTTINTAILSFTTGYVYARAQVRDILLKADPGKKVAACEKILDN